MMPPVRLRELRGDVTLGGAGVGADGKVFRDEQVDTVGAAVAAGVDPGELDVELFGSAAGGAKDSEPAGSADGGDDVPAVGEGQEREVDAEPVAECGVHRA
jgi:hypothetical protein